MVYQTIVEFMKATGESGILAIFLYANSIWAGTTPLILFAFFCIIFIGIYVGQKTTTGEGNPIISFAVASTFTMFISAIFALKVGLINVYTLVIVFIIWIMSVVALFLAKDRL